MKAGMIVRGAAQTLGLSGEREEAASYDLRSGQTLRHCSEEQVRQFNEQPYPRLGKSFVLKSSDKELSIVTIPTQLADLQVFLTNGDEIVQASSKKIDIN